MVTALKATDAEYDKIYSLKASYLGCFNKYKNNPEGYRNCIRGLDFPQGFKALAMEPPFFSDGEFQFNSLLTRFKHKYSFSSPKFDSTNLTALKATDAEYDKIYSLKASYLGCFNKYEKNPEEYRNCIRGLDFPQGFKALAMEDPFFPEGEFQFNSLLTRFKQKYSFSSPEFDSTIPVGYLFFGIILLAIFVIVGFAIYKIRHRPDPAFEMNYDERPFINVVHNVEIVHPQPQISSSGNTLPPSYFEASSSYAANSTNPLPGSFDKSSFSRKQ